MKLVCSTYSNNEDYNAECNYAYVDLTPALAQRLLARHEAWTKLKATDQELSYICFWDGTPVFVETLPASVDRDDIPVSEYIEEQLYSKQDWMEIQLTEKEIRKDDNAQRVEIVQAHISEDGLYWSCSPKHTSITIETKPLEIALLKKAAGKEGEEQKQVPMEASKELYAPVSWHWSDVQTLRPSWSQERCEEELQANASHLQDRTIELGWDVLNALISAEGGKNEENETNNAA